MSDWQAWKLQNACKIKHIAGYEEKFVDLVLSHISLIGPNDVVPQYGFIDDKGKNRRIDFMIINNSKGYLLPVELDGEHKPNKLVGEDWADFLRRQNSLIRSFGKVLRYTNSQMFNNPELIIREISLELISQQAKKSSSDRVQAVLAVHPASPLPQTHPAPKIGSKVQHEVMRLRLVAATALIILGFIIFSGERGSSPSASRPLPMATTIADANATSQSLRIPPNEQNSSADLITATQARAFVGQHKIVCGAVAGVKELTAGLFINFERPYPNEAMSAVIWRDNLAHVGTFLPPQNGKLCVVGLIRSYDGKPQIIIYRPEQIDP